MKKILKAFLIIVIVFLIIIQFIIPAKNAGEEIAGNQIISIHEVPDDVQNLLKVSCYDCHSNTTHYPWYDKIQPIAWFLNDHIVEGKKELNFSIFATYTLRKQYKKFTEIQKQVKDGEMPLFSYTIPHRKAVLSADQKLTIESWAANSMKKMEAKYPMDSLIKPK